MNVHLVDAQGKMLLQLPLHQLGGIPSIGSQIVVNHQGNAATFTVQSVVWDTCRESSD